MQRAQTSAGNVIKVCDELNKIQLESIVYARLYSFTCMLVYPCSETGFLPNVQSNYDAYMSSFGSSTTNETEANMSFMSTASVQDLSSLSSGLSPMRKFSVCEFDPVGNKANIYSYFTG